MLPHTEAFTQRHFYTHTLLHADTFTHTRFYTQTLLHTDDFTHRCFYTQTLLRANPFTHKSFHLSFWHSATISRERVALRPLKSQFHLSFWHPTIISLAKSQFYYTFGHQNVWIRAVGRQCHVVIQKVPLFLSFRRSNLISCEGVAFRAVSLALPRALREK